MVLQVHHQVDVAIVVLFNRSEILHCVHQDMQLVEEWHHINLILVEYLHIEQNLIIVSEVVIWFSLVTEHVNFYCEHIIFSRDLIYDCCTDHVDTFMVLSRFSNDLCSFHSFSEKDFLWSHVLNCFFNLFVMNFHNLWIFRFLDNIFFIQKVYVWCDKVEWCNSEDVFVQVWKEQSYHKQYLCLQVCVVWNFFRCFFVHLFLNPDSNLRHNTILVCIIEVLWCYVWCFFVLFMHVINLFWNYLISFLCYISNLADEVVIVSCNLFFIL